MAISVGFTDSTGEGAGILSAGQHPCVLKSVKVVEQRKYQSDEMEEKIQFTFERTKPEPGQEDCGICSVWTGLAYGDSRSKMTALLDNIFGRDLTQAEVRSIDLEAMAGTVRGYVLVVPHTKQDGTRTTKFGSFIAAKGQPLPVPTDFPLADFKPSPNASRGNIASVNKNGPADPPDFNENEDLEDPFAEDSPTGPTSAQQGHTRRTK